MSTFSTCTSSTRPSSPTDGDVLFETDTKNVIIWDGSNWRGYQNDGTSGWSGTNAYSMNFDGTDDRLSLGSVITPSATSVQYQLGLKLRVLLIKLSLVQQIMRQAELGGGWQFIIIS